MEKNVYVVLFLLTCGAEEVFVLQQIVDTEKSNIPIREPSREDNMEGIHVVRTKTTTG